MNRPVNRLVVVSIPSRGFWFFEGEGTMAHSGVLEGLLFQSPRGDFGFLKANNPATESALALYAFQSPRGDFGFLKMSCAYRSHRYRSSVFQSPRGDFGFLKAPYGTGSNGTTCVRCFNPLAGILVF